MPKVRYTELCGGFLNETAYHQPEDAELNLISVKCRVESGFHSTPFKQTGSPLYQHHFEFYFHIQMLNAEQLSIDLKTLNLFCSLRKRQNIFISTGKPIQFHQIMAVTFATSQGGGWMAS